MPANGITMTKNIYKKIIKKIFYGFSKRKFNAKLHNAPSLS